MVSGDILYGGFALGAFVMTALSTHKAWRTQSAGGISVWFPLFFACWGAANLFVFTYSMAPVSVIANVLAVIGNLVYMGVIIHNIRKQKFLKINR